MSGPAVLERGGYCDAAPFLPGLLRSTVSGMAPARREWDYLQCGRLLLRTTRCRQGHGLRSLLKALLAHFPDLVFADSAGGIKLVIENSPTEHETRPGGMLFKSSGIINGVFVGRETAMGAAYARAQESDISYFAEARCSGLEDRKCARTQDNPVVTAALAQVDWTDIQRITRITAWEEQVLFRLKQRAFSVWDATRGLHGCPVDKCLQRNVIILTRSGRVWERFGYGMCSTRPGQCLAFVRPHPESSQPSS
ncbi:hypothetical protein PC112_g2311 [Phytophthora cactorum]|nr:hypothetical protein PC112_g2311 [Phytophthora cactorum]KAG4059306.1 hypothetical protein PC123_g5756 [Phytophthora cactorum]